MALQWRETFDKALSGDLAGENTTNLSVPPIGPGGAASTLASLGTRTRAVLGVSTAAAQATTNEDSYANDAFNVVTDGRDPDIPGTGAGDDPGDASTLDRIVNWVFANPGKALLVVAGLYLAPLLASSLDVLANLTE